ncbi:MAG TPA: hypothetical protein VNA67_09525 [Pseudonocardiaceae bacterium]|nr:hypothetical protein [Pseudonocardiaceae bacterium]
MSRDSGPLTAAGGVGGELGEQAFGDVQLDDPAATRRRLGATGVGSAPGDARQHQVPGLVSDDEAPRGAALRGSHSAGKVSTDRSPTGNLAGMTVPAEHGGQPHSQLHSHLRGRLRREQAACTGDTVAAGWVVAVGWAVVGWVVPVSWVFVVNWGCRRRPRVRRRLCCRRRPEQEGRR